MPFPSFLLRVSALALLGWTHSALHAGPYPPAPPDEGTTAIASNDNRFVAWATRIENYTPGIEVGPNFQNTDQALGPAVPLDEADPFAIVSLGRGGQITLAFAAAIVDGPGADFAVFENSVIDGFLELAFVEVSSDGETFVRFPTDSVTPSPVGAFANTMLASEINGFAGNYPIAYGTPFDLADLPATPGLDTSMIRYVRLVDVVGDGSQLDSDGDPVYDPFPTIGSAGFDLDAVGVVHQAPSSLDLRIQVEDGDSLQLTWTAQAGTRYRIEASDDLVAWNTLATVENQDGPYTWSTPHLDAMFYRVVIE